MIHCIHGNVGTPNDWAPLSGALLRQDLSRNTQINAINLWQYLRSNKKANYQTFSHYLNSLAEKSNEPQNLIAYSLGGRLALHALIDHPTYWQKAVIVSAHTGLDHQQERTSRIESDEIWAQRAETLPWQTFLKHWNNQGVLKSDDIECLSNRSELEEYRQEIADSYRIWSLGKQQNLLPQLEMITSSILWIVGEEDTKFKKIAKQAVSILPDANLLIIPNTAHRAPWQDAETFTDEVINFLNS